MLTTLDLSLTEVGTSIASIFRRELGLNAVNDKGKWKPQKCYMGLIDLVGSHFKLIEYFID